MPIHSLTNAIAAEADASASTSMRARNMQQLVLLRWIAVVGHVSRTARLIPLPPSHTTTSGGAMRSINATHAEAFSLRATCQPST